MATTRRCSARRVMRRQGGAVTVLAYGTMVYVALAAVEERGIDAEVIDLRTLLPDLETIVARREDRSLRCRARGDADLRFRCRTRRWCKRTASTIRSTGHACRRLGYTVSACAGVGGISGLRRGVGRALAEVMEA